MTQIEKNRLAELTAKLERGETLNVDEQKEFDTLKIRETDREEKAAEKKVEKAE